MGRGRPPPPKKKWTHCDAAEQRNAQGDLRHQSNEPDRKRFQSPAFTPADAFRDMQATLEQDWAGLAEVAERVDALERFPADVNREWIPSGAGA